MNYEEIRAERERQNVKWGEQNHPDVCSSPDGAPWSAEYVAYKYRVPTEAEAKGLCQNAHEQNKQTFAHIAVEELCEAIAAAAECQNGIGTVQDLRKELVQLAAVVVQWIEAIDRREEEKTCVNG